MAINTIEEIIDDIRRGRMVILMDDEGRENEGDLILAAECVKPEDINFMARYGRGLICLTLSRERCEQLRLPLMVSDTNDKHMTNFTVSIEAASGVTTGISAADRATTVRAAVAAAASHTDLVQPGHIFPIMARPGGVLTRAGHTEAGCDLARLAGFEPASVIVEILNEDGTMARRPELEAFAVQHGLKIGTIADLIEYRLRNERTIAPIGDCNVKTAYGPFRLHAFQDTVNNLHHLALVAGEIHADEPTLVRVHMQDTLCDVLRVEREDCGLPLHRALEFVARRGTGVIVILRAPKSAQEVARRIRDYRLIDEGVQLPRPEPGADLRTYGIGAQIIADLGVRRMRVIGAPKKLHALSGYNLEIVDYVECDV